MAEAQPPVPTILIDDQPVDVLRFRYPSETGHRCVIFGLNEVGKKSPKAGPKIKLENCPATVTVKVSLYTQPNESHIRCLHVHMLGGVCQKEINILEDGPVVEFRNLDITRVKQESVETILRERQLPQTGVLNENVFKHEVVAMKQQLNSVVLCFEVFYQENRIGPPVFSNTIYHEGVVDDLTIVHSSLSQGLFAGNEEMTLLTGKQGKDTEVIFCDDKDWKVTIPGTYCRNHHQYGIILKTPEYTKLTAQDNVKVHIKLRQPALDRCGKPWPFTYYRIPNKRHLKPPNPDHLEGMKRFKASTDDMNQPSTSSAITNNVNLPLDTLAFLVPEESRHIFLNNYFYVCQVPADSVSATGTTLPLPNQSNYGSPDSVSANPQRDATQTLITNQVDSECQRCPLDSILVSVLCRAPGTSGPVPIPECRPDDSDRSMAVMPPSIVPDSTTIIREDSPGVIENNLTSFVPTAQPSGCQQVESVYLNKADPYLPVIPDVQSPRSDDVLWDHTQPTGTYPLQDINQAPDAAPNADYSLSDDNLLNTVDFNAEEFESLLGMLEDNSADSDLGLNNETDQLISRGPTIYQSNDELMEIDRTRFRNVQFPTGSMEWSPESSKTKDSQNQSSDDSDDVLETDSCEKYHLQLHSTPCSSSEPTLAEKLKLEFGKLCNMMSRFTIQTNFEEQRKLEQRFLDCVGKRSEDVDPVEELELALAMLYSWNPSNIFNSTVQDNGAKITCKDRQGNSVFHLAAKNDLPNIIARISKLSDYKEQVAKQEFSPFDFYNLGGLAPIHIAVLSNSLRCVEMLCLAKCNVNMQTRNEGLTPLHLAVDNNCPEVMEYLLTHRTVDVNLQATNGNTALHLACMKKRERTVRMLMSAKADPKIENYEEHQILPDASSVGLTCLDVAMGDKKIFELISEYMNPRVPLQPEDVNRNKCQSKTLNLHSAVPNSEIQSRPKERCVTANSRKNDSNEIKIDAMNMLNLAVGQQLARLLDPPGPKDWRALLKSLNMDMLVAACKPAESPTLLALELIDPNDLYIGLQDLKLEEGLEIINNFLCQSGDLEYKFRQGDVIQSFSNMVAEP